MLERVGRVEWGTVWGCIAALALSGCLPQPRGPGVEPEVEVLAGIEPAPLELDTSAWQPGLQEARWALGGGGERSARVWVPDAAAPRSLVVLLHGAIVRVPGRRAFEPADVSRMLITCLAAPALAALDPLIIAPYSADGQWWKRGDTAFVLGLLAAARARWPALGARSVVMGYSNGGIASWYFARLYPEHFAAAIPMAADDSIVGTTPLPVYAIQGDKDELFPIEPVRAAIAKVSADGTDVTLRERHRAGHMSPCDYEPELALAGQWLEQHAFAKASRIASP